MRLEERLTRALQEQAESRHVDVHGLYSATVHRLGEPSTSPRPRLRDGLLVAAAAVVVAGIAGGGLFLQNQVDGSGGIAASPDGEYVPAEQAPVDTTFTCPHTVNLTSFANEMFGGRPDFGVGAYGAERFQLVPHGESGVLRIGTAEGTLTAKTQLRRWQGSWVIESVRRCTGPNGSSVPVNDQFDLGAHGRPIPAPPAELLNGDMGVTPDSSVIPIDDRSFYNRVGIIEHIARYAFETTDGIYLAEVEGGQVSGGSSWSKNPPSDHMSVSFIPVYGYEGFEHNFDYWTYYSTAPATLTAQLKSGQIIEAQRARGDDWRGTLHMLLARPDHIEKVILEQDGERRTFQPQAFG